MSFPCSFDLFLIATIGWIDVCPRNGNLLAVCSGDSYIKILDKRESKFVKVFDPIQKGKIL